MELSKVPVRLAQLSDIHCGESSFDEKMLTAAIEHTNRMSPDLAVIAGDLTKEGYGWEFEEARSWINRIDADTVVVPGNHDSRNVGYVHFEELFGPRYSSRRIVFDGERAERLGAPGLSVVAVDSSEPDLNEGRVGRERYPWIREQFAHPDDIKVFVIHHHLVPIPGTGRERNIILDAGDVLAEITQLDIDLVLAGHRHVPYFWGVNGTLICHSGTASTWRVRGKTPPSWTELQIDASTIKAFLHYPDGRRELSLIFSRKTLQLTREAFYLTDDFLTSNALAVGQDA